MEHLNVGLILKDKTYAAALARGLSRESRNMNFTVIDKTVTECGLYLTDSRRRRSLCAPVIVLSETPDDDEIFIYEDCRVFVDRMIYLYYVMTGRIAEFRGNSSFRLVVFAQACGGSGTTSTALAAARMLNTIYGSRCLYLNICPFDDSRKYIAEQEGAGIVKLLYHLKKEYDFPMGSFVQEAEGISVFVTHAVNKYAMELTGEMFNRLLAEVNRTGSYDYLFVDAGNYWSRENLAVLGCADCVVVVSGEKRRGHIKYLNELEEMLIARAGAENVLRVMNFADDTDEDAPEGGSYAVSREDAAFVRMGGYVRIDLSGNYGLEIAQVAKGIRGICNGYGTEKDG